MSGRPFAVTLVGLWAVISAIAGGYHSWVLVSAAERTRIVVAVAALGGIIGVMLLAAAIGVLRTSNWARSTGLLALGLATLVVVVGATMHENDVLAYVLAGGNVLAFVELFRHKKPFSDTEGRVEDVSAHVGR